MAERHRQQTIQDARERSRRADADRIAEKYKKQGRDAHGVKTTEYTRHVADVPVDSTDTDMAVEMLRNALSSAGDTQKQYRKYKDPADLNAAANKYIRYISDKRDAGIDLIPDIEGFCNYIGISRDTFYDWLKSRTNDGVSDTLNAISTAIAAYKKQLALHGKIPPVVFAIDFNNNHGYVQQNNVNITAVPNKIDQIPDTKEIEARLINEKNSGNTALSDDDLN